ncbi:MAG: penicillin-binding protein activator [Pseudomonadota bacterium]
MQSRFLIKRASRVSLAAVLPRAVKGAGALALAATLAACVAPLGQTGTGPRVALPEPVQTPVLGPANGEVIGDGPTRIAMLVPLSAPGAAGQVGTGLRNAAALAMRDPGTSGLQLVVKDSGGTPEGASTAAAEAISEGAQLIVGPLFSPAVKAAGGVAGSSGVPVLAFSTDPTVASRNVYLLSFQVGTEVDRVVSFAASQGRTRIAAMVPESNYGTLALSALRAAASRSGAQVVAVERFGAANASAAASRLAPALAQADLLFIPEGGTGLAGAIAALRSAGADLSQVKLAGTGVWNGGATLAQPEVAGGWFAGPDPQGFRLFADRYTASYGAAPARIAPVAYDAVRLAANLAPGYPAQELTNPNGFAGTDGIFRFRPDGNVDRGLAVLEIRNGAAVTLSPAPTTFQAGSPQVAVR